MFKSARISLAILFSTILAIQPGCTTQTDSPSSATVDKPAPRTAGTRGGRIVLRLTSPPNTFNYLMAADEAGLVATLYLLGSRLVSFDHSTLEFTPGLAESWTMGDDGRTVDIVLRDGLKFSDGHPLTTDDVIFTLQAIYDKRTGSPAFRDSMLVNGKEIETKRVDGRNLQFIFPEPVAKADNYLDNLVILPKHVLQKDLEAGRMGEIYKIDADPASIVTSGPFMVESTVPGERAIFKRNPHYWKKDEKGEQLPYLDTFVIEAVPDANNAFARLTGGEIDIVDRIRATDLAAIRQNPGSVRVFDLGPGLSNDHIWFNLNKAKASGERLDDKPKYKWFNDSRFRRAVSHAVDRESISRTTMQGLATPLYGFVAAGNRVWLDPDLPKTEYDLDRARSLLSEAGFAMRGTTGSPELFDPEGNKVEFTLIVPAENEPRKLMAAVIQQDLAKLGIAMQIAPIDFQGVTERWSRSYDYDAISLGVATTGIEPSAYANFLLSSASTHQWHPSQKTPATEWEAKIDRLFAEQARERDPERRRELMNELQAIVVAEMPIIPVVSRHIVSAANVRVGNHAPSNILPYSVWNAEELFVRQ
jgi:peptide/nickel transport system substrate-binding protein